MWRSVAVELPGIRVWEADRVGRPGLRDLPSTMRLWLIGWDLHPTDELLACWAAMLSAAERRRLESIGTPRGRRRFAASHAGLRGVHHMSGDDSPYGSLSHTDALAVVVVAEHPVGVDVEADRPRRLWRAIDSLLWPDRPSAAWGEFLRRWVTREAVIKRDGLAPAAGAEEGVGYLPKLPVPFATAPHAVALACGGAAIRNWSVPG